VTLDWTKLKTYSVKARKSKVDKAFFAGLPRKNGRFKDFLASLPALLKAQELKEVVRAVVEARRRKKPVLCLLGAHVIKCGLSPVIIDLIRKGTVTSVALNGAGIIHDFEIAFNGSTSEDVARALKDGSFGMARETAQEIHAAIREGVQEGRGLGESVGLKIQRDKLPYRDLSIAYACARHRIPLTVHVALGTDIIHQHPSCSGADTGEATMRDFRRFTEEVARLDKGGVVVHAGSAVILPEVFLKALSVARNLTGRVKDFTTVTFDMNFQYRPYQNVALRPIDGKGRGYYILGHHEIMLPLWAWAVTEAR
jgi:hypothetical protein